MQVKLSLVEKDIKSEIELLMAKYDMTENDLVVFLFEKCFVVQDSQLAENVANIVLTGQMPEV